MNLIDTLKLWDTNLFLTLNGYHAQFFDGFMFAVSAKFTWVPLYISVLYLVIKRWKRESIWVVFALIACIVIADQVSSGIIKNAVERLRPSHADELKGLVHLVNGYSGGKFGFVSSHAANAFGFAMLSTLLFRQKSYSIVIFIWAILIAYSRIYLGVHYPLDILGGIIVGVLSALICFTAIKKLRPSLLQQQDYNSTFDLPETYVTLIVIGISYLGIVIYSLFAL